MTKATRLNLITALALAVSPLVGCKDRAPSGGPAPAASGAVTITAEARTEAAQIFGLRCTPCHGSTGGGDGPASASLSPRPRNFHDPTWQSSVTDEHIERIIQYGGAAVGKSPAMPATPDLAERAAVIAALREHVRSFRQ